jgi:CMP-N-acetylneuraminic acid synthetase
MPRDRSIDINEELDLAFAEFLLSRQHAANTGSH